MKLISVLMSTYNSEKWVLRTLKSLLDQTHKNLQVVVVDDGSLDKTKDIIRGIKDSRIELYEREHKGISSSLNFGLTKAKSDLIIKADSDDLFLPEKISVQYKFVCEHPEYGVVGTNFKVIDENDNEIMKVRYPEKDKYIKDQLPRKCCVAHGSLLYRRIIVSEAGGYNEQMRTAEDWDLFLRLIEKTKFYNIQDYLTLVRKHTGNVSGNSFCKEESLKVPVSYFERKIKQAESNKEKAKLYFNIGYYYYYENQLDISLKYFNRSLKYDSRGVQIIRYYIFNKYLQNFLTFLRRSRFIRVLDIFRHLDKNNIIFRNKY